MNKKVVTGVLLTAVLGASMFGVGVYMGNESYEKVNVPNSETVISENVIEKNNDMNTNKEIPAFENIDIRVMSGDVTIEIGEEYSLGYYLHGREKVKRFEVVDNTLYFDTGFDTKYKAEYGDWKVVVTVPATAVLKDVNIKTAAGDIVISDKVFSEGSFETVSGVIELSGITAKELDMKAVSDEIEVKDSRINEIEAETVSGEIKINGEFEEVEMKSVSGDISVSGKLTVADIENVSGDVDIDAEISSVDAKTVGGRITINGENQGKKINIAGENPFAKIKTISGDITIR